MFKQSESLLLPYEEKGQICTQWIFTSWSVTSFPLTFGLKHLATYCWQRRLRLSTLFFCDIQKSCHVFTIFFQTELLLSSFLNVINGSIRFYFTRLKANLSSENDWDNFAHSSKMLLLFNYNEINILSLERSTNARRYKFESA